MLFLNLFSSVYLSAQISPGELSKSHIEFDGIVNCTKCHTIGSGVPDAKCLDCHKEIQKLIQLKKGYHSSSEVNSKTCINCHSDHHGNDFNMVKLEEKKYNHKLTGYNLVGAHQKLDCKKCHKPEFIKVDKIAKKKGTYLGLGQKCLDCHQDYHKGTLSEKCLDCHNMDKFKPADKFNHDNSKFKLKGAHIRTKCVSCHEINKVEGKQFQKFTGLKFSNCIDCHKDVHDGKFGQNCIKCHNINSFKQLNSNNGFNHNLTNFPLQGKHLNVECKSCHKLNSYTSKLKFENCKDCHVDFHKGQFIKDDKNSDCKDCHSILNSFTFSTYSLAKHQKSIFVLQGAHIAIECASCHKINSNWNFKNLGKTCNDCHKDNHKGFIDPKFYPMANCKSCHGQDNWSDITFNHNLTNFNLEGKHKETSCKSCHFRVQENKIEQKFKFSNSNCTQCHKNIHGSQFEVNNETNCKNCHNSSLRWSADLFNHNKTNFPLDGKHLNVQCSACHFPLKSDSINKIVIYESGKTKCIDCHY